MPCPYFNIKKLTRKMKSHVVDRAAYLAGERLREERTSETYNHTDKDDVICTEILLPDHAPREYADRGTLWNAVDAVESRKNARVAREVVMAVPKELTMEDNIKMVRKYCMEQFVSRGMIVDLAFHDPKNDYHNPHAHALLTVRALDENGRWTLKRHLEYVLDEAGNKIKGENGKWKVRIIRLDWDERDLYEKLRQAWEDAQNAALEAAGRPERVSMKSYKEQGIDRIPQLHMSPAVVAMERKGIRTRVKQINDEIKKLNAQKEAEELAAAANSALAAASVAARTETGVQPFVPPLADILAQRFSEREKEQGTGALFWHRTGVSDSQRFEELAAYMRACGINSPEDLDRRTARIDSERKFAGEFLAALRSRAETVERLLEAGKRKAKTEPVHKEYLNIRGKKHKEKFASEHGYELDVWKQADRIIKKTLKKQPFNAKALRAELAGLNAHIDKLDKGRRAVDKEFWAVSDIWALVHGLVPEAEHESGRTIPDAEKQQLASGERKDSAALKATRSGEIQPIIKPRRAETDMEL